MKVGIMSMQRVVNNGSFLQAYSLKRNLEMLGADVEFVDYEPGKVLVDNSKDTNYKESNIIDKILDRVIAPKKNSKKEMEAYWKGYHRVDKEYVQLMLPILGVKEETNYKPELDLLVIGSDEVFNCLQPNPSVGFSGDLFGANQNAKKIISYAASFGNTTEDGLRKYGIYDEVSSYISKFDGISARDNNSYSILEKMSGLSISKNVDPVFLYDFEEEVDEIKVPISDYIVVYAYAKRISKAEAREIKKFAKKNNKKIVCLCAPQDYLEGYIPLNPFEVLAYVKHADYVVTDTFHGTVFSIKYNRNFATFIRNGYESTYGNNKKLMDLLDTFDLSARSVNKLSNLSNILCERPNFSLINQIIDNERKKSIEYLSRYIYE